MTETFPIQLISSFPEESGPIQYPGIINCIEEEQLEYILHPIDVLEYVMSLTGNNTIVEYLNAQYYYNNGFMRTILCLDLVTEKSSEEITLVIGIVYCKTVLDEKKQELNRTVYFEIVSLFKEPVGVKIIDLTGCEAVESQFEALTTSFYISNQSINDNHHIGVI